MVDPGAAGAAVVTAGSVVAGVGTFLPWVRSGARNRSSYAIFDLVDRLGFAPGGPVAWSLRLWPLAPLLLVAVVLASWAAASRHLRPIGALISTAVAVLWVGGTALAIVRAPRVGLFGVGAGPWVTAAGAALMVVGAVLVSRRESAVSAAS